MQDGEMKVNHMGDDYDETDAQQQNKSRIGGFTSQTNGFGGGTQNGNKTNNSVNYRNISEGNPIELK